MVRFYALLGVVAVLTLGIVGYSVGSRGTGKTVSAPVAVAGLEDPAKLMEMARPVTRGNPDAPFTIIEFADFQCPYCGEFFQQVEPLIQAEFVATGRAKFVYYDFPLTSIHPNAFLAARAGHCAEDQQKFWAYHDILYRNQNLWVGARNPSGFFEDYAEAVGLDRRAFERCLRSAKHADLVTANMKLAGQLQLPGTPTLMVAQGNGMGRRVEGTIESIRAALGTTQPGG